MAVSMALQVPQVALTSHLLSVDEEVGRPRANSDPSLPPGPDMPLPEITIEDFTDNDSTPAAKHESCSGGLLGGDAGPRPRANTCPEDLFRKRNTRPPTPPPATFRKGRKFRSGSPSLREPVSFTHHRLTKLTETEDAEEGQEEEEEEGVQAAPAPVSPSSPSSFSFPSPTPCGKRAEPPRVLPGKTSGRPLSETLPRPSTFPDCGQRPRLTAGEGERAGKEMGGGGSGGADRPLSLSPVQCRFPHTPRGMDSHRLQAC